MSRKDVQTEIQNAAKAHSDLNIFAAVVAMMEGGMVYTETGKSTAARITALCQREQQRQLTKYDAAVETIQSLAGASTI